MRGSAATLARLLAHCVCLAPLALLLWDAWRGDLTANPIQAIELRTGKPALVLLIGALAVTPAWRLTGWAAIRPWRRTLGLYSFLYASLHALTFVGLDYGFNPALLPDALLEKRYALAGMAAFVALAVLALTSSRGWQRRVGPRWQRLHLLTYVAAMLAATHYLWQTKGDLSQPLLWAAFLALLLAARIPAVAFALTRLRYGNGVQDRGGHQ